MRFIIWALCILTSSSIEIQENVGEILFIDEKTTPVHVTKGAVLVEIQNSIMYTDSISIYHPIPDLPDNMVSLGQYFGATGQFLKENVQINLDSFKMLKTLNKMLTYGGLEAKNRENIILNDDMFESNKAGGVEIQELETPVVLQEGIIGQETYSAFLQLLNGRRKERQNSITKQIRNKRVVNENQQVHHVKNNTNNTIESVRRRRGIPVAVAKIGSVIVQHAPKIFKAGKHLWKFGRKLFHKPGQLLDNVLMKSIGAENLIPQTITNNKASEFVVESWKGLDNVTKEEAIIRKDYLRYIWSDKEYRDKYNENQQYFVKKMLDVQFLSLVNQADQGNLIFTSIIYNMHLLGLLECRDGHIPIQFLPRSLLLEKLKAIQLQNFTMALGFEDIDLFYKLKPAECAYDSDGGLMTIKVPVVPKQSSYGLHKVQPLSFSYQQKTCQIRLPEMYVAFDQISGSIYPLSSIEASECLQHEYRKCQIPQQRESLSVENNLCLKSLLQPSSGFDMVKSCPLQCVDVKSIEAIQISSNSFMIAHFPETGVVECDNGYRKVITHNIQYGAIKITINCFCKLILNGITVVQTSQTSCLQQSKELVLEYFLPIHLTSNFDILSNIQDSSNRYLHFEGVFKPDDSLVAEENSSAFNYTNIVWNYISDGIQYVILIYIIWKLQIAPALMLGMHDNAAAYAMSNYDHNHECKLPSNIYYLILSVVIMLCTLVGLKMFKTLSTTFRNTWERFVNQAAQNQLNIANVIV